MRAVEREEVQPRNIALPKLKDGVRIPDRKVSQSSDSGSETESHEQDYEDIADNQASQDVAMT